MQVVVLSRIIPDKEPALSSAEGIKTLIERLEKTKSDGIKGYAADCIARLAHTRAGKMQTKYLLNFLAFTYRLSISFTLTSIEGVNFFDIYILYST